MKLIPFDASFEGKNKVLNIKQRMLESEGPQILRWLIDGAVMDHALGNDEIPVPTRVSAATKDYRAEEDTLAEFVADTFEDAVDGGESTREVYDAFKKWCIWRKDKRMGNWSQKFFNNLMIGRGIKKSETNGRPKFRGIQFKPMNETSWRRESGAIDYSSDYEREP